MCNSENSAITDDESAEMEESMEHGLLEVGADNGRLVGEAEKLEYKRIHESCMVVDSMSCMSARKLTAVGVRTFVLDEEEEVNKKIISYVLDDLGGNTEAYRFIVAHTHDVSTLAMAGEDCEYDALNGSYPYQRAVELRVV